MVNKTDRCICLCDSCNLSSVYIYFSINLCFIYPFVDCRWLKRKKSCLIFVNRREIVTRKNSWSFLSLLFSFFSLWKRWNRISSIRKSSFHRFSWPASRFSWIAPWVFPSLESFVEIQGFEVSRRNFLAREHTLQTLLQRILEIFATHLRNIFNPWRDPSKFASNTRRRKIRRNSQTTNSFHQTVPPIFIPISFFFIVTLKYIFILQNLKHYNNFELNGQI